MHDNTPTTMSGPIRILLVEDDDGDSLLLQRMLSGGPHGFFHFRRAPSLSVALREVVDGGIDLILLDLTLPDSWGLDTFVRLRAAAGSVPIVVFTGLEDEALASRTIQQGAQDYLVKGAVDASSLARAIRCAIDRCRAQQALAEERAPR